MIEEEATMPNYDHWPNKVTERSEIFFLGAIARRVGQRRRAPGFPGAHRLRMTRLDRFGPALTGANTHHVLDVGDPQHAVTHGVGARRV